MEANLIQKVKQSKFKYYLMPLILLILSGIFFTLSHLEVINSPNTNSGDVGFGYAASGIISLILAVILSIILSAIFIFRKK
nr:MAG TPA: transmembrane domain protein [Caudoviricetes sp.]